VISKGSAFYRRLAMFISMVTRATTSEPKEWLTIHQLAEVLSVSKYTVYKWASRGYPDFPLAVRLPNAQLRVERADLEQWMLERAQ
jgi:predicted DNA-binding transcriptional regulator AlpA